MTVNGRDVKGARGSEPSPPHVVGDGARDAEKERGVSVVDREYRSGSGSHWTSSLQTGPFR